MMYISPVPNHTKMSLVLALIVLAAWLFPVAKHTCLRCLSLAHTIKWVLLVPSQGSRVLM